MTPLLLAKDINKQFGGVMALRSASFALNCGEAHALIGENGAGKSTLARILAGSLRADRGTVEIAGQPAAIDHPLDAQRLGIGIIYQELDLFSHLTVGENLAIGNLRFEERALVSRKAIETFCRPFLRQVGLELYVQSWVGSFVARATATGGDCASLEHRGAASFSWTSLRVRFPKMRRSGCLR